MRDGCILKNAKECVVVMNDMRDGCIFKNVKDCVVVTNDMRDGFSRMSRSVGPCMCYID